MPEQSSYTAFNVQYIYSISLFPGNETNNLCVVIMQLNPMAFTNLDLCMCVLPVRVKKVIDISKLLAQLKAEMTDTAFPRMPVGKMAHKTTCTTKDG